MDSRSSEPGTAKAGASSGAARGAIAGLARARAIGGAFLVAAIAVLIVATGAQAEEPTANQLRYQYDAYYHIVYYSPEAFECFRPGNRANIGIAIAKTQEEIQLLRKPLAELTSVDVDARDVPAVNALREMIAHLNDILSRLLRLPPCPEQPAEAPVTPGPPPPDNTGQNGGDGPDQNGNGGPDTDGGSDQGGCFPGGNGGDQGGCGYDQNQQHGMNQSNNHNDGGNGHHNNH